MMSKKFWQHLKIILLMFHFFTLHISDSSNSNTNIGSYFHRLKGKAILHTDNLTRTYPVTFVNVIFECIQHCISMPYCSYFTYYDKSCEIFHAWQDSIVVISSTIHQSYYTVHEGKWHKIYVLPNNSKQGATKLYRNNISYNAINNCQQKTICSEVYRDHFINTWKNISVENVKVVLEKNKTEVVTITFNGTGSDNRNWFKKDRVLHFPWNDFNGGFDKFNMGNGNTRFQIYHEREGCNDSIGWMMVYNRNNSCLKDSSKWPEILYSNKMTRTDMTQESYSTADSLSVYVELT